MTTVLVSSTGQIEIPKTVRDQLNFEEGTEVLLDIEGEVLTLRRLVKGLPSWHTMRGMFRNTELLEELAAEHASELSRDDARNNQGR